LFIKDYPYVKTILAHGRPIDQAYKIIRQYSNAHVDTAFMPIEDINFLIENGVKNKIIFGSDYPIDSYFYPEQDRKERYASRLNQLKKLNVI
jgi:predicted TIM-barrel fold metal-dependent hydrolase